MSDEDREIDIESDADDEDGLSAFASVDDKRAHHNALERKRRDHIKDSFHSLRDCVPQDDNKTNSSSKTNSASKIQNPGPSRRNPDSKTSRAQILRQASDYIIRMRDKTSQNDRHIQILKQQNDELQAQIKALQKSQSSGKALINSNFLDDRDDDDYESYEDEPVVASPPKRKKAKTSHS